MFIKSVVELSKSFPCHRAGCLNYVHVVFSSTCIREIEPCAGGCLHCSCPSNQPPLSRRGQ